MSFYLIAKQSFENFEDLKAKRNISILVTLMIRFALIIATVVEVCRLRTEIFRDPLYKFYLLFLGYQLMRRLNFGRIVSTPLGRRSRTSLKLW